MKIRNGFVSNSSSSSFVVGMKSGCSENDIKKIIDGMEENFNRNKKDYAWRNSELTFSEISNELFDFIHDRIFYRYIEHNGWKYSAITIEDDYDPSIAFFLNNFGNFTSDIFVSKCVD